MTLRLPIDLQEVVTEEARVAGDLSRVVLFALRFYVNYQNDLISTVIDGSQLESLHTVRLAASPDSHKQTIGSRHRARSGPHAQEVKKNHSAAKCGLDSTEPRTC